MREKLQNEPEEKEGTSFGEGPFTIDEVVDKIYKGANIKLILVFITATATATQTPMQIYVTIFAGFIPYTQWKCISDKCFDLLAKTENTKEFYTSATMCDNELVAREDFEWTSDRTSFSMDWGFYCGSEAKFSTISSFFFIGATLGLLVSTAIFDRFGRRNGAIAGNLIGATATLVGTWAPSFEVMLVVRIFQGVGMFIQLTGIYCWVVELTPSHLRSMVSFSIMNIWTLGYVMITVIGYMVTKWNYIFLTVAIMNTIFTIPQLIYPISPRFALVRGREEEAKKTLESFSRLCNNEISMETVSLTYKERAQNFLEQVKDFITYPTFRKETILGIVCWFIVAVLFYGFSFGWVRISSDLYTGHLAAAISKFVGYSIAIPGCNMLGRKKCMLTVLAIGLFSNLLAMPDVEISDNWTLEYVASLIGNLTCSAAFGVIYLYSSELAPTSHRGMVMSLSSASARVGSFTGTYVGLLYAVADRRVPLTVFAGLTCVFMTSIFFMSDPTGRRIPETPIDVEVLSGNKDFVKAHQDDIDDTAEKKC
ncbi:hypothetical protein ACHWQZ_G002344 [Mnemiopsis leidyi]